LQKLTWLRWKLVDFGRNKPVQALASIHGASRGGMRLQSSKYLVESTNVLVNKDFPCVTYRGHTRQGSHPWSNVGDAQWEILWEVVKGAEEAGDGKESFTARDALRPWECWAVRKRPDSNVATELVGRHGDVDLMMQSPHCKGE
jgi:hypothetical protein